jgi:hypothetical protein
MGLVEVVDVEDQPPVRGRKDAEVREVGVAAELDVEARARGHTEVRRHDSSRAAIEGEGRDEHPPVADRDQLRNAGPVLLFEDLDWIGAIRARLPPTLY